MSSGRNQSPLAAHRQVLTAALARLLGHDDEEILEALLATMSVTRLQAGDTLYRLGEPGEEMHIVLSGRLGVILPDAEGRPLKPLPLGPGEIVGEMAVFSGRPRAATVIALRDTSLAVLSRDVLDHLSRMYPLIFSSVLRTVIDRLLNCFTRPTPQYGQSIFFLPLHDDLDLGSFRSRLELALSAYGSVSGIASFQIDAELLLDAAAVGQRLDLLEREHDFLLMYGDGMPSAWNRRCLGHTDAIVLVADARNSPRLTALDRWLDEVADTTFATCDLVLLHPRDGSLRSTCPWLRERKRVRHHYHVRLDHPQDLARLARHLSGQAICLVLAGGGARGFAHLGVIRALHEIGIPVDAVSGASFGALAATGLARGLSIEESLSELEEVFSHDDPLGDYTIPVTALIRGRHLERVLAEHLPMDIEDLWIPFFAVSSDLSQNQTRVHESGPLWRAIRASISLPAILPPAIEDGHLLVDGGLLNNLPIDAMRQRFKGEIIAVDLALPQGYTTPYDHLPNGLEYFHRRLVGELQRGEIPTLSRLILHVTTLASRMMTQNMRYKADLYLNPPVHVFDFLAWSQMRDIAQVGFEYALPLLKEWASARPNRMWRQDFVTEWLKRRFPC